WCSSMFTLPIITLPSYSSASSSRSGAIILHGPHHSAQKSTSTGTGDCKTCCAKFSCVSVTIKGEAIRQMRFWARETMRLKPVSTDCILKDQEHPNHSADGEQSSHCGGNDQNFIERADRGSGGRHCSLNRRSGTCLSYGRGSGSGGGSGRGSRCRLRWSSGCVG